MVFEELWDRAQGLGDQAGKRSQADVAYFVPDSPGH